MLEKRSPRNLWIGFRATAAERRAIAQHARRRKLTVAEFVRILIRRDMTKKGTAK